MKKVLLSLSMLAAVMSTASAQSILVGVGANDDVANVVEYNNPTDNSGIYWWASECYAQFPNFGTASTTPVITDGVKRREGGALTVSIDKTQVTNSGTADCVDADAAYVPFGLNFGDDNGAATDGAPYYIDISGAKTFSCKIKASAAVAVRVQFEDLNGKKIEGTAAVYGSEYSFNATTTFQTWTLDLTGGVGFQHSGCAGGTNPCAITGFDYTKVTKVLFFVQPGSNTFVGTVTLDDVKIGKATNVSLSTSSAAANIASTKVFPNPTTGSFTAQVSLVNNVAVSVILTDMMGKQISTKAVDANGEANFETAGLANGLYTVTYVIDGTPAKTELVVVK